MVLNWPASTTYMDHSPSSWASPAHHFHSQMTISNCSDPYFSFSCCYHLSQTDHSIFPGSVKANRCLDRLLSLWTRVSSTTQSWSLSETISSTVYLSWSVHGLIGLSIVADYVESTQVRLDSRVWFWNAFLQFDRFFRISCRGPTPKDHNISTTWTNQSTSTSVCTPLTRSTHALSIILCYLSIRWPMLHFFSPVTAYRRWCPISRWGPDYVRAHWYSSSRSLSEFYQNAFTYPTSDLELNTQVK